jgi:hypothetical protein
MTAGYALVRYASGVSIRSRILSRAEARGLESIQSLLGDGEVVDVAVNGQFGTLSSGHYGGISVGAAGASDPFDVYLTTRRLIAVRSSSFGQGVPSVALECDRGLARISELRRNVLCDRVELVFRGETLRLSVMRRARARVDQLMAALEGSRPT